MPPFFLAVKNIEIIKTKNKNSVFKKAKSSLTHKKTRTEESYAEAPVIFTQKIMQNIAVKA